MIDIPRYVHDLAARYYPLRTNLLLAVIKHESNFRYDARGDYETVVHNGVSYRFPMSYGLCQLHLRGAGSKYQTAPEELIRPDTNVGIGASYLRECIVSFDSDIPRALSAYNQGISGARLATWAQVNYDSYVVPVMSIFAELQAGKYQLVESPLDAILAHLDVLYGYYLKVAADADASKLVAGRLQESAFVFQERIAAIKRSVQSLRFTSP